MLRRLQLGLEHLYRVETNLEIETFLISASERNEAAPERRSSEQLLLREDEEGLSIGVYFDAEALSELRQRDAGVLVDSGVMSNFLLLVEGVSHFVYVAWSAQSERQVSALELELQAEVDKYVTCLFSTRGELKGASPLLRRQLFENFEYCCDLSASERERYRIANDQAQAYAAHLEQRFVDKNRVADMYRELRRFYRLSLPGKLDAIKRAA